MSGAGSPVAGSAVITTGSVVAGPPGPTPDPWPGPGPEPPPPPPPPDPPPGDPPPPPPPPPGPPPPTGPIRGFGALAAGGAGGTICHVTNLNDSGAGSLRDCLSASNRYIVFDVSGTIPCDSFLTVAGLHHITVDGYSAPAPGITLTGHTLYLRDAAHDIILFGFRHHAGWDGSGNPQDADCITITLGCYNIVLDHLSLTRWWDEGVDCWNGTHDVTVQWCILGGPVAGNGSHNVSALVGRTAHRISYHHVLFYKGTSRNPQGGFADDAPGAVPVDVTIDVVNCVMYDFKDYGIASQQNSWINAVGNYLVTSQTGGQSASNPHNALYYETGGRMYTGGGNLVDGINRDGYGSESSPFPVASYAVVAPTSAVQAARDVLAGAGCFPRDATDLASIASIPVP